MANHKSAAKRARQTIIRNARMSGIRSAVATAEKKLRLAIEGKKKEDAVALFKVYSSRIDKAAQKGIVHVNRASRKIGRLARQISQLG